MKKFLNNITLLVVGACLFACDANEAVENKTPITIGAIGVAGTTQVRAADNTFFQEGDVLNVNEYKFAYNAVNGQWTPVGGILYQEDWTPQDIALSFGSETLVANQTTAEALHGADYIKGAGMLTGNVISSDGNLTHAYTRIDIRLTKTGEWSSAQEFLAYVESVKYDTGADEVSFYVRPESGNVIVASAVMPFEFDTNPVAFEATIATASGRELALKSTVSGDDFAGKCITISANLEQRAPLSDIVIDVNDWYDVGSIDDLAANEVDKSVEHALAFVEWANTSSEWNAGFTLEYDIDLSDVAWEEIALAQGRFYGVLDGNGHSITGLKAGNTTTTQIALCKYLYGAVKNLTFIDAEITGTSYVGVITASNSGTIENCIVSNSNITGTGSTIGAIAASGSGTIINCTVENCFVEGVVQRIGGVVGLNTGKIINSKVNNVTVDGTTGFYVGGIAGDNYGLIINSHVDGGEIKSTSYLLGGIAGAEGSVIACSVNNVTLSADNELGGISNCGSVIASLITNSTINTTRYSLGGIIGRSYGVAYKLQGNIAMFTSVTNGRTPVGGVVGETKDDDPTLIKDNYWYSTPFPDGTNALGDISYSNITDANHGCTSFTDLSTVVEEAVSAMNTAIADYNADADDDKKCNYQWQYTAQNGFELVATN
ncbi:hypothetical protein [Bacteroides sp. 519]|uniref:hypothetical protein n=1 Tax=Bacteroides sp. 519 TaxID=2302937 RepID=UPI0013D429FC|nr:hypothetical protein [Bacteroides sp. 519]NDV59444.1 hypothetical protein [Bacteroides sp. 519]